MGPLCDLGARSGAEAQAQRVFLAADRRKHDSTYRPLQPPYVETLVGKAFAPRSKCGTLGGRPIRCRGSRRRYAPPLPHHDESNANGHTGLAEQTVIPIHPRRRIQTGILAVSKCPVARRITLINPFSIRRQRARQTKIASKSALKIAVTASCLPDPTKYAPSLASAVYGILS